jgi:hypothetical protein
MWQAILAIGARVGLEALHEAEKRQLERKSLPPFPPAPKPEHYLNGLSVMLAKHLESIGYKITNSQDRYLAAFKYVGDLLCNVLVFSGQGQARENDSCDFTSYLLADSFTVVRLISLSHEVTLDVLKEKISGMVSYHQPANLDWTIAPPYPVVFT